MPKTWYLHDDPSPPIADTTSQSILTLDPTAPGAGTLFNYDKDRDAEPGLLIAKGGIGATETDTTKMQVWRSRPLAASLKLNGAVRLDVWSAMKVFEKSKKGSVTFYVRHFDGSSYTEVGSGTLTQGDWQQGGSATWVKKTITTGALNYTIPAGHYLEIKLIVNDGADADMWFAYDTSPYASRLTLP